MHTLLIAGSLLLALCGCLACLALLRFTRSSVSRRLIQMAGLFVPTIALALLSTLMAHFLIAVCFLTAPPIDVAISEVLTVAGAVGIGIAILLNLARATLLPIHLRQRTWDAPAQLQAKVLDLTASTGLRSVPTLRVAADARPWALVAGLFRPRVVLSSGLLSLLDEEELSAVLCHEMVHIQRGDLWWTALCGVLRDLTWFLPTTRYFYHSMLAEQEVACDDQIVEESRRLALASALVRVWQAKMNPPSTPHGALALFSPEHSERLEARVRRLLENPGAATDSPPYRALAMVAGLLVLFTIAQVGAANAVMGAMGCSMYQLMVH
jgi:beta-lactamase regulating signal transducer with metallopeptidase domain